ncbi:hypothetical protein FH972_007390 [Carpinus fangiana]|uniref:Uncharacterized protein n=1 Tax=Carpinus fangiana TaxID=176857 RepID=A0A5N6QVI6_9ROSI|nr:hypothetical protein FH972_007390 [Carpinus fangiana]
MELEVAPAWGSKILAPAFAQSSSIIVFQFRIHLWRELRNSEVQFKVWEFGFRGLETMKSLSVEREGCEVEWCGFSIFAKRCSRISWKFGSKENVREMNET